MTDLVLPGLPPELVPTSLRLGAAMLIGSLMGLNRDLHGKPTGVRTLGIVCLGAAMAVLASVDLVAPSGADVNAVSRTIQGVLTGVGFIGAGVIIRNSTDTHIHGLTTAACTWLTACLGILCGTAKWSVITVALVLVVLVLTIGGRIETALHQRWLQREDD